MDVQVSIFIRTNDCQIYWDQNNKHKSVHTYVPFHKVTEKTYVFEDKIDTI